MVWLNKSRKSFLLKFFVVGACVPALWICIKYSLKGLPISWGHSEILGWVLYSAYCVTFPTNILFLDAEHLPEIIFMLVIAMPLNGGWFALVGLGCWYLRNWLSRLNSGPAPG